MACATKSAIFCVTLVLVSLGTSTPKADALIIDNINILGIVLVGVATCSPTVTGPCTMMCPLIPNLRVTVRLGNNSEIASATTENDGSFRIIINVLAILSGLNNISDLKVFVALPILGCPLWAAVTLGHLEGIPALVSVDRILSIASLRIPALNYVGA